MTAIKVEVPASSANLGPGFDCLALALDLRNEFRFFNSPIGDTSHVAYRSYRAACAAFGVQAKNLSVITHNQVPVGRGLGSAATCVVAGVLAAKTLAGLEVDDNQLLEIAASIEGHPDNVAAALFGGVVVASPAKPMRWCPITLPKPMNLLALLPHKQLSTQRARAALPEHVSRQDAVFNIGQSSLLVAALTSGRYDLIRDACRDQLHQPYRTNLIPDFDHIVSTALDSGALGAYLSGAGPAIMVWGPTQETEQAIRGCLEPHDWVWELRSLQIGHQGAVATVIG